MIEEIMIKPLTLATFILISALSACSSSEQDKPRVDLQHYKVPNSDLLQQRFIQLNQGLSKDYQQFKKNNNSAFSDQSVFDVDQPQSLYLHAVSRSSLKPVKMAYCEMMNGYFAEMYYLGNQNLNLVAHIQLPNAQDKDLTQFFVNTEAFYDFILNRYSSYRQAQEIMGYGCNLKASLH